MPYVQTVPIVYGEQNESIYRWTMKNLIQDIMYSTDGFFRAGDADVRYEIKRDEARFPYKS